MLSSLKNIFKVPDLRNKVVFTLLIIGLYQLGANLIVPFVSIHEIHLLETQAKQAGILGFLNLFSGGGLLRMALFGLGIMPYITSSIIIQLLSTVIPKLEEWRDQGAVGQKKITQTTRYLTIALALLQSAGPRLRLPQRGRRPPRLDLVQHRPDPPLHLWRAGFIVPHPHRRDRFRHVAGRAHHPAGHRQRDVHHHLRQRGGRHPGRRRRSSGPRAGRSSSPSSWS